jgi:hypothetical protein
MTDRRELTDEERNRIRITQGFSCGSDWQRSETLNAFIASIEYANGWPLSSTDRLQNHGRDRSAFAIAVVVFSRRLGVTFSSSDELTKTLA